MKMILTAVLVVCISFTSTSYAENVTRAGLNYVNLSIDDDFIDELKRYENIAFTNKFEYAKFKKTSKDSTEEFSTYKKVENIWTISLVAIENFRSSLSTAISLDIPHSLEENKKLLEELTKAQKLSDEVLNDLLSGSISCTN